MFQTLGLFGIDVAGIFYSILAGIYTTVAKVYDIMLSLVTEPNENFTNFALPAILDMVYVLAGVFMLFRVMIAMIQYFLNPDQITDSSTGGGKLITRIVTSIVLLLLLQPSGMLLGDNGVLKKIELAVLEDDGIVSRIIRSKPETSDYTEDLSVPVTDVVEYPFIENVYAANKLVCYYFNVDSHTAKFRNAGRTGYSEHSMSISGVYKIEFYNNSTKGETGKINCSDDKCKYSYTVRSGQRIAGEDKNGKYSSLNGNITMGTAFDKSFPSSCPKQLEKKKNSSGGTYYAANKNHTSRNKLVNCYGKSGLPRVEGDCYNTGIMGGYSSFGEMKTALQELMPDKSGVKKDKYKIYSDIPWISNMSEYVNPEDPDGNFEYMSDLSSDAVSFAQTVGGTFIDCHNNGDCNEAKDEMFKSSQGNKEMVDYIDKDVATNDWFTGAIVGVALIIYLIVLCIDIIVRRLKLLFMEILSPIPIVSYVDPKDKMFNTWFKTYVSIYLDLFIKLIAMSILVNLLKMDNLRALWGEDAGLLVKFFYIVAILVFAKIIPSLISKIFNLESNGGSFKDIVGMAKGAAGFGAGAVIGGAVGAGAMAATMGSAWKNTSGSFGKRALNTALAGGMGAGTALGSALRGAGAGSKGKVFEGAKGAVGKTGSRMGKFREGISASDMIAAGTLGKFGMDYASMADKGMIDDNAKMTQLDKIAGIKGDMENTAEDSKFMKTLREAKRDGLHNLSEDKMQELRSAWIQSQLDNDDSALRNTMTQTFGTTDENGNTVMSWDYTDNMIEGGKQAGLAEKLTYAQDLIANNTTVGNTVRGGYSGVDIHGNPDEVKGISSINNFKDVDTAGKIAKKHQTKIRTDQAKIKESDKYRGSAAARDFGKSNK